MNRGPEVLAPAGSMDALKAAVECGADAVYLGAGHFNARRNAKNFSDEELAEAIEYCHVRGVQVHMTLNTLVSDDELPDAIDLIEKACSFGVDALIVQDLGVAALVRETAPDMELHASTQMGVMTPEGFRALAEFGFKRAVLPREFSFEEILAVREATMDTGLDLEMFIHGALCMCVSGQCYLSAMMGGRSGNRGLCAQPCRLRFAADGGRHSDHALSLRDLSSVDAIPALYEAGVLSFKIEGRMKRPEYVAAAVTACRNAVGGIRDDALTENLDAVFSRSGHTDGYLKSNLGHEMFGTRRKDDVVAAAPILKELSGLYQKETRANPISLFFRARLREPLQLTAIYEDPITGMVLEQTVDSGEMLAEAAQNAATPAERIVKQLQKTGGTGFSADSESISVDIESGLFLPASALNDLRRSALSLLSKQIQAQFVKSFDKTRAMELLNARQPNTEVDYPSVDHFFRLRTIDQLPETLDGKSNVAWIIPLDTPADRMEELASKHILFGVEIPRGLYEHTERVRSQLKAVEEAGAAFAYAATLDSLELAKRVGLPVIGSFTMNVFNHLSRAEYRRMGVTRMTLSQELSYRQMVLLRTFRTSPQEDGLLVYGQAPVMLTRNMPDGLKSSDFENPAHLPELTDRKGVRFPVAKNGDAYELLNSRPLYLADKQSELPGELFQVFWFTTEDRKTVSKIIQSYETGETADTEFTRGLYQKGVL